MSGLLFRFAALLLAPAVAFAQTTGSSFTTGLTLGTARNNHTGFVGMRFTVGATPLQVLSLGRIVVAGNAATHTVKLVRVDGTDVAGGATSVNTVGGTPEKFVYGALSSPVTLAANTSYYLVSSETGGGDQWHDANTVVATASAATINNAIYRSGSGAWTTTSAGGNSYGPVNFRYTTQTAPGFTIGKWQELILSNGVVDRAKYADYAAKLNTRAILDNKFGPRATDFGTPAPATTIAATPNTTNGIYGSCANVFANNYQWDNWYAQAGNLLYSPNNDGDPGMARARNGSMWNENESDPNACFEYRISWESFANNREQNPDGSVLRQSWIDASGGKIPAAPIDVQRGRGKWAMGGVVVFNNGLIGVTGNGNTNIEKYQTFPFIKLPATKVPTAVAVTHNNEFALVTIWDTQSFKGQVAVIALNGGADRGRLMYQYMGLPSNLEATKIKLLGYVDLPFKAPTAIAATNDRSRWDWLRDDPSFKLTLETQAVRDNYRNGVGADGKSNDYMKVTSAGYAVIASRSENKVAFLDLQPLFQYYRTMYLSASQSTYDQTKSSAWPFTFDAVASQKPVITSVIDVVRPTAVCTGFPTSGGYRRRLRGTSEDAYADKAFITTMDGKLLKYSVGGLNTTAAATAPVLETTLNIGKNPSYIDNGRKTAEYPDELWITCRGSRAIYCVHPNGTTVLRTIVDKRMVDPVSCGKGRNGRSDEGHSAEFYPLSVMDFGGSQAINYIQETKYSDFKWGYTTAIPGMPYIFNISEVN